MVLKHIDELNEPNTKISRKIPSEGVFVGTIVGIRLGFTVGTILFNSQ